MPPATHTLAIDPQLIRLVLVCPSRSRQENNAAPLHQPLRRLAEVGNAFAVGSRYFEAAIEHVGSDGESMPLAKIRRQTAPSRACFESLQAKFAFYRCYAASAEVESITERTRATLFAGNPPFCACARTVASSGAM